MSNYDGCQKSFLLTSLYHAEITRIAICILTCYCVSLAYINDLCIEFILNGVEPFVHHLMRITVVYIIVETDMLNTVRLFSWARSAENVKVNVIARYLTSSH